MWKKSLHYIITYSKLISSPRSPQCILLQAYLLLLLFSCVLTSPLPLSQFSRVFFPVAAVSLSTHLLSILFAATLSPTTYSPISSPTTFLLFLPLSPSSRGPSESGDSGRRKRPKERLSVTAGAGVRRKYTRSRIAFQLTLIRRRLQAGKPKSPKVPHTRARVCNRAVATNFPCAHRLWRECLRVLISRVASLLRNFASMRRIVHPDD